MELKNEYSKESKSKKRRSKVKSKQDVRHMEVPTFQTTSIKDLTQEYGEKESTISCKNSRIMNFIDETISKLDRMVVPKSTVYDISQQSHCVSSCPSLRSMDS